MELSTDAVHETENSARTVVLNSIYKIASKTPVAKTILNGPQSELCRRVNQITGGYRRDFDLPFTRHLNATISKCEPIFGKIL